MQTKNILRIAILAPSLLTISNVVKARPNILLVITDDQSWPHAGAYGTKWVNTPAFDQLAKEGMLFNNAFVSAPSCAPSRFSILTGRHFYQNQEGGVHGGFMPAKFPIFTDILAENGYQTGFTGKGCGPFFKNKQFGLQYEPFGKAYNTIKFAKAPIVHSFGNIDYASNFEAFLKDAGDKPFCFSFNCWEPHRPYIDSSGIKNGKNPNLVILPKFLPEAWPVKNEVNDYALEIDYFDKQLARFIEILKEKGMYENTLIVVTSDNGMPFPNAKMNCYEYGTHVPLVVSWLGKVKPRGVSNNLVLVPEVASFFVEAAGLKVPVSMMNSSIPNILGLKDFTQSPSNDYLVWGKEKHNPARENNLGYPIRAIRTKEYLLIKNYEPERWPAGDPPFFYDFKWEESEATMEFEIDEQNNLAIKPFFDMHTKKRPEFELFDIKNDPFCMNNLASKTEFRKTVDELRIKLEAKLKTDGDPRLIGNGEYFESTPTAFTNPKNEKSGVEVFKTFPPKQKYTEGMARFDHSNDSIEAIELRKQKN